MGKLVRLMLLLVIVTSLAGCSGSANSPTQAGGDNDDGMMTHEEYRLALTERIGDYTWPAEFRPDPNKIAGRMPDDALLQDGYETMVLMIFSQCAWNLAWIDASRRGDAEAQEESLTMLRDVIPSLIPDPAGRRAAEDAAAKAALGDPSGLQPVVRGNCEPVNWTMTP